MTGQIPPYGKNFKHDRADSYHPSLGQALYRFKWDEHWYIRADKGSKRWYIFHNDINMGKVWPSLTVAMSKLVEGVKQGYYDIKGTHLESCSTLGSGRKSQYCNCGLDVLNENIVINELKGE
jgi:hypothetical protein